MDNAYLLFSPDGTKVSVRFSDLESTEFFEFAMDAILIILRKFSEGKIEWENVCEMVEELADSQIPLKSHDYEEEKNFGDQFAEVIGTIALSFRVDYIFQTDEDEEEDLDIDPHSEEDSKARVVRIASEHLDEKKTLN